MAARVTATVERLPSQRAFRLTEFTFGSLNATVGKPDERGLQQSTELFFVAPSLWRVCHVFHDSSRIDQGRDGEEAWDLANGVLVQYANAYGRIDPARPEQKVADINQPLRSRLASFGYCLTGGLHLIHVMRLAHRELTAGDSADSWVLRAWSDHAEIVYTGTWNCSASHGTVVGAHVRRSAAPDLLDYRWTFEDWRFDPRLPGAVAGKVTGRDRAGMLDHIRTLDLVDEISIPSVRGVATMPRPDKREPILGTSDIRQRDDRRHGRSDLFGWDGSRWLRVLGTAPEHAPGFDRVCGWLMALIVVVHVLWLRHRHAGSRG